MDQSFAQLDRALRATGLDGLDTTSLSRAMYSSDASLYRVIPGAVVRPRTVSDLETIIDTALVSRIAITARGAGTSCAGNAIGPGLIVDTGRHLTTIRFVDAEEKIAVVEPGVVEDELQDAVKPFGLRYGPDPSTHSRCTIGGMIGNNACGPRALGYGRAADNVVALKVITGTGEHLTLDSRVDARLNESASIQALWHLVLGNLGTIRTEFGRFSRQVSGYSMEHLLPERGFNVARFLAGSEGTLAVITEATVKLVAEAPWKLMVVLGYPSMPEAADAMPAILKLKPTAVEGLDARIVDVVANKLGSRAVPALPSGAGWLFVELTDDDEARLTERAATLVAVSGCLAGQVIPDPAIAAHLWKIRADGAGLAAISLAHPAYPGWEDAAVPPNRLGAYLREFDDLLDQYGLHGLPYGHFGDGCIHCRIDFPLTREGGTADYRDFILAAARLVAKYGGSMSGEHGDGRARSELLPIMYSDKAMSLFAAVKKIFDPHNLLNPGVLVDPDHLDESVRSAQLAANPLRADPHFVDKVHRCTGVGACISTRMADDSVMCPSFQATRDEKDSTRGRARVLQEMLNGTFLPGGWNAAEVHQALDLCLSCKGCRRDCPTGTDMASLKSHVLHRAYHGRIRPRTHYWLGWLPRWGRLLTAVPGLSSVANHAIRMPLMREVIKWLAGVDQRRSLPSFAKVSTRRSLAKMVPKVSGKPVVLWVDSFSDAFDGTHVPAIIAVLLEAGYAPKLLERKACCGLTWITTGQRTVAARQIRQALEVLAPVAEAGIPIVGTEPSCLSVWRGDAAELVDDPRVALVASHTKTLAELLTADPAYRAPDLRGHTIVVQPHCHQASVVGWDADEKLLRSTGASLTRVSGCCGLAGNFGEERGHYDISVKIFESSLLPAIRAAGPEAIILADGFSCRTQVRDLTDQQAITLAELLAAHQH